MDDSRPTSPEAPPEDLWSSILDSVSSSRSIPSKQVLLLGQPSTGKSSLVSALLQKPVADEEKEDQKSDFALGYDWADVRDDADEGECGLLLRHSYQGTRYGEQTLWQGYLYILFPHLRLRILHYYPTSFLHEPYHILLS